MNDDDDVVAYSFQKLCDQSAWSIASLFCIVLTPPCVVSGMDFWRRERAPRLGDTLQLCQRHWILWETVFAEEHVSWQLLRHSNRGEAVIFEQVSWSVSMHVGCKWHTTVCHIKSSYMLLVSGETAAGRVQAEKLSSSFIQCQNDFRRPHHSIASENQR